MRFLFRIMFWLGVVLILLPSGGSPTKSNALVSASDALSAAKATVTDAQSFCGRQPEACAIGSQAALVLGHRAQAGAKMLYDYLHEHFGADDGGAANGGGKGKSMAHSTAGASRDTLAPADLVAAWRGPRSRKETRLDRPE
jgi:hypothetical protein